MKIVITSKGESWDSKVDPRFGRADYLFCYNDETDEISVVDNTDIQNSQHGAGPQTAKKLFDMEPNVLLTGNGPGGNASAILDKSEVEVYIGASELTVKEAYEAFKNGKLSKA